LNALLQAIKPFVIATAASVVLSYLFNCIGISLLFTNHWMYSILFFLLLFSITAFVTQLPANAKDQSQKILALSIGRLLVALVFILIYIIKNKTNAKSFSIHFILHFIIFLTFDTYYLIKTINEKK
jgi:hypothetical protein